MGEHGKSFAVVANEVRQLAQQSANAVEQINAVLEGNDVLVSRASQEMQSAVDKSEQISTHVDTIEAFVTDIRDSARSVSRAVETLADQDGPAR